MDFVFEDAKGDNETKLSNKLRNTAIHNGKRVARYETVAEENEKLRLRTEELERHETGILEELKLKIGSFERFEKNGFEEQKLRDVENQNLVEELGRVRSQLELAQEQ